MKTGTVRWYSDSKGCGFIVPDDGSAELLIRRTSLASSMLRWNERVRYEVCARSSGPVARNISQLA